MLYMTSGLVALIREGSLLELVISSHCGLSFNSTIFVIVFSPNNFFSRKMKAEYVLNSVHYFVSVI